MEFFKNFSIYGLGICINAILKFLLIPYYSKALDVNEFGIIGLLWAIVPILTIIVTMSLQASYSIKYYSLSDEDKRNLFLSIIITISLFLLFMMSWLFLGGNSFLEKLMPSIKSIDWYKLFFIAYLTGLINLFLFLYRIEFKSKQYMFITVTQNLITISLLIWNISFLHRGITGFINGTLLANIIVILILAYFYIVNTKLDELRAFKFRWSLLKGLFKMSSALVIGSLFEYVLNAGDRYLIERITKSLQDVGQYTMGYKLGELFNTFYSLAFLMVSNPILLRTYSKSIDLYKKELNKYIEMFIIGTITILLIYNTILEFLFTYIIDSRYSESSLIVLIVASSYAFYGISQIVSTTTLVKEMISDTTKYSVLASLFNVGINLILIPWIGIKGAAYSTLLSYLLLFVLQLRFANKLLTINFNYSNLIKLLTVGVICFVGQGVLGLLNLNVLLALMAKSLLTMGFVIIIFKAKWYPYINDSVIKLLNTNKIVRA